jgi:choline dehydrogenase-like flavoprotein
LFYPLFYIIFFDSNGERTQIWQRGAKEEYELWSSSFGNGHDWTLEALLPYFKKVETWSPPPASPAVVPVNSSSNLKDSHGASGPIHVKFCSTVYNTRGLIAFQISYNTFLTQVDQPAAQAAHQLGVSFNSNPVRQSLFIFRITLVYLFPLGPW